jgi:hypothetical protein
LHNHWPIWREQWCDSLQHLPCHRILAAKVQAIFQRPMPVDRAHRAPPQVQAHIQGHDNLAQAHRAGEITVTVLVALFARRALAMVVMEVNRFQPPGRFIFLPQRVIDIEVDFSSLTTFFNL